MKKISDKQQNILHAFIGRYDQNPARDHAIHHLSYFETHFSCFRIYFTSIIKVLQYETYFFGFTIDLMRSL